MKSLEQLSLPEKKDEPEKQPVKSMTVGRMEDFKEFLKSASADRILGRNFGDMYGSEFEKAQKEDSLILDFLKAESGLDSNTKRKLYHQILEKDWKPKLEEAIRQLQNEIEAIGVLKDAKVRPLNEEEKNKYFSASNKFIESNKKQKLELIKKGLFALKQFGADKEKIKELEERFKKVKW